MEPIQPQPRRWPRTFFIGLGIIALCEAMLFTDVALSKRWVIHTQVQRLAVTDPVGPLAQAARFFAANMTALVWPGYLFLLEGLLVRLTGTSPARKRPHHFTLLLLASILMWSIFDIINFNLGMRAWVYVGIPGTHPKIPGTFYDRLWSYATAFAAVVPGMLLSGQVLIELGAFNWAYGKKYHRGVLAHHPKGGPINAVGEYTHPATGPSALSTQNSALSTPHLPLWIPTVCFLIGCAMVAWVLYLRQPRTNYVMWMSLAFFLDPINYWLGRPSLLRDAHNRSYVRLVAACAGGLICGFLWEFWNYWALTKWTYHLPFLGASESIKYFEMPIVGLLGFIPFGAECWVMWQTIRIPWDGLSEPLPDDRTLQ